MSGGDFTPRRERDIREVRAACKLAVQETVEIAIDFRDLAVCVVALGAKDRERLRIAERALDAAAEALVLFDARCGLGDAAGAAAELRAWLGARR